MLILDDDGQKRSNSLTMLKDYVVENQIDLLVITETWLDLNNQQTANIIN